MISLRLRIVLKLLFARKLTLLNLLNSSFAVLLFFFTI